MLGFDVTKIVRSQKQAASSGRIDVDQIVLSQGGHRRELGVLLEKEAHLSIQIASKALTSAAQRVAFRANIVQHAIGKSEE